ncbi:MAG TPA: carbohydrate kinase family protein [Ignavibacteriaceae bacterium]|nr:carbohydrate kinase family protein [Ignavibacteriaceae bacterium]
MKLLVVGHSVADTIDFRNEISSKPGGIFYSIAALNNFKKEIDKICLITAVDKKNYFLFEEEYKKIDVKIFNNVESVPKVHLKIEEDEERHEWYENINQHLVFDIKDLNVYDGIFINMITGFDITLEQLKEIRKNYKGSIYFDVHAFSRGLNEKMQRHFRVIPDFKEWASNLDIIQANKNELKTLNKKETEREIIEEVFNCGIKYLIITLEDKGVEIFFKENNLIKSFYEPAINIEVKNKVGCGDVFGALFFYSYISDGKEFPEHKKIIKALKLANIGAGCVTAYDDMNKFKNLKNDVFTRLN